MAFGYAAFRWGIARFSESLPRQVGRQGAMSGGPAEIEHVAQQVLPFPVLYRLEHPDIPRG